MRAAVVIDEFEAAYLGSLEAAVSRSLEFVQERVIDRLTAKAVELSEETLTAAASDPFDLSDFTMLTAAEWAEAFEVEAADIIADVVVDAATGQPLIAGINVSDDVIFDMIDTHVGRLRSLGTTVQDSVARTLRTAIQNRTPFNEVVRQLQAVGPIGEASARAIARTELTAATNGGMLSGWRDDQIPFKMWHALHDTRTRDAHLAADGQKVPTEQDFEVGGRRAQYPGDPRLPIDLRVNCRCYMTRIGQRGMAVPARLMQATRRDLYRLAQELQIPGRSLMRKDELFQAIDRYRSGFGEISLAEMTRAQLLIRAKLAKIKGRWRMTKPELMIRLRDRSVGRAPDRVALDSGHAPRALIEAARGVLEDAVAAMLQREPAIVSSPGGETAASLRLAIFERLGGKDHGWIPCIGCGAKLHHRPHPHTEIMSLVRANPQRSWNRNNVVPCCRADAAALEADMPADFTIEFATATEFANPWHDHIGRFAPKGTGREIIGEMTWEQVKSKYPVYASYGMDHAVNELAHIPDGEVVTSDLAYTEETVDLRSVKFQRYPISDDRTASVQQAYESDHPPPPVLLVRRAGELHTVDGHHRLSAQEALGRSLVPAVIANSLRDDKYSGAASIGYVLDENVVASAATHLQGQQFANPWHDEIGRFAPKGTGRNVAIETWGTDRKVTIEKSPLGHKHTVTTASGDTIELLDGGDVLLSLPEGERVISDLLNGAADAHDLSPGMQAPKIMAKPIDEMIADVSALWDVPRDDLQYLRNCGAFVVMADPKWILINPSKILAGAINADWEMPAMTALGPARYKVMHEYGHLRIAQGVDQSDQAARVYRSTTLARLGGGMSDYGNTNPLESHAEAFAEWAARGGQPGDTPHGRVVAEYQSTLNWNAGLAEIEDDAIAAAGPPPSELPLIVADGVDGPFYVWADGRTEHVPLGTIVASPGEFGNPWHDYLGRFAPAGTGRMFNAGEVRRDAARARELVEAAGPVVKNKATAEHQAAVEALQAVGRAVYDDAYDSLTDEQRSTLEREPTLDPETFPYDHEAIRRVEQVLAERVIERLGELRRFGTDGEFSVHGENDQFVTAVSDAMSLYPTDWYASSYGVSVTSSGTTGGWYDKGTIGLPNYGTRTYTPRGGEPIPIDTSVTLHRVAVHELGHHLEVINPLLLKSSQIYLATRKTGAMQRGTKVGLPSDRRVVPDEFHNAYTGAFYNSTDIGGSDATEVLTTHMYSLQFALDGPSQPSWSIQDESLFARPHSSLMSRLGDAWHDETLYALGVLASL